MVMAIDCTMLFEHGMSLSYHWVRNVLYSMEKEGKKMRFIVDMSLPLERFFDSTANWNIVWLKHHAAILS